MISWMSRVRSPVVLWKGLTPWAESPSKLRYNMVGPLWGGKSWATAVMSVRARGTPVISGMAGTRRSSSISSRGKTRLAFVEGRGDEVRMRVPLKGSSEGLNLVGRWGGWGKQTPCRLRPARAEVLFQGQVD